MPLRDHFHPPLSVVRHWEAFHSQWAGSLAAGLNRGLLPPGYFAEPELHVGSRVEVDVATFDGKPVESVGNGGTATATAPARVWTPPAVGMVVPALFPDSLEVLVYNTEAGPTLVAAVELVSPGNKDRRETRRAFAAKCAGYLQQGIGLVIVDVVTNRHANLHNELFELLEVGDRFLLADKPLYTTAYRPVRQPTADIIEVWTTELAVDQPLPLMPLALDKGLCVPLDLETAYVDACQRNGLA